MLISHLLQLLGDFVLQTPYRGFALNPLGVFCPPGLLTRPPHHVWSRASQYKRNKWKNLRISTEYYSHFM